MKEDGERDPSGDTADGAAVLLPPPADIAAPPGTDAAAAELPPTAPPEPQASQPAEPPAPAAVASPPQPARLAGRGLDLLAFAASRTAAALLTLGIAAGMLWLALPADAMPDLAPLGERLAVTLPLIGLSLLLACLVGGGLGLATLLAGRPAAWLIRGLGLLTMGLSPLLLALLLVLVVAGLWGWLPPGGFVPWQQHPGGALLSLTLPAIALALPLALLLAEAIAEAAVPMLERGEVERGAETGLTRRRALFRLVLPEALPDALARLVVPLSLLPPLTLVVEAVFYLPGLSRSVLGPLAERDAAGLFTGLVALATLVVLCRLGLDIARGLLDPRLTDRR